MPPFHSISLPCWPASAAHTPAHMPACTPTPMLSCAQLGNHLGCLCRSFALCLKLQERFWSCCAHPAACCRLCLRFHAYALFSGCSAADR